MLNSTRDLSSVRFRRNLIASMNAAFIVNSIVRSARNRLAQSSHHCEELQSRRDRRISSRRTNLRTDKHAASGIAAAGGHCDVSVYPHLRVAGCAFPFPRAPAPMPAAAAAMLPSAFSKLVVQHIRTVLWVASSIGARGSEDDTEFSIGKMCARQGSL